MVEALDNRVNLEDITVQKTRPFVVVGIPAYNEEKSIARVVLRSKKFANKVVVCDDGSEDMTAEIAKGLGAEVISHEENLGYGGAIRSLFSWAKEYGADVLVTLDGDGQHDPSEILTIVKPIAGGRADIVVGSRFVDSNGTSEMPSYRRLGAKVITKMVNGSKMGISDAQSGFRAYSRGALHRLSNFETGMGASVEILLDAHKKNLKICEVPSSCKYKNGNVATSTNHPVRHGASVVKSIIRLIIEEKPLTFLGIPGILCLLAGIGFGVWLLQIYSLEQRIVTNVALASLSFVLIGVFVLSTALTLYSVSRISEELSVNA